MCVFIPREWKRQVEQLKQVNLVAFYAPVRGSVKEIVVGQPRPEVNGQEQQKVGVGCALDGFTRRDRDGAQGVLEQHWEIAKSDFAESLAGDYQRRVKKPLIPLTVNDGMETPPDFLAVAT
jgi:hypothetical protein